MVFKIGDTLAKERYAQGDHFGFEKGYTPWNTGLTKEIDEKIKKMSENSKGKRKSVSTEFKKGNKPHNTGKIGWRHKGTFKGGEKHWNWKGGKTSLRRKLWATEEYKKWRRAVFERDNYTCQNCGQYSGKLEAHHIKLVATNPELIVEVSNGRTLCKSCHNKEEHWW